MKNHSDLQPPDCATHAPAREFSPRQELLDNTPYIIMILVGAIILAAAGGGWALKAAAMLYVGYGIAGSLWIMVFVCPYCHFYDTRSCPCGYGRIAVKLTPKKNESRFVEKFKKHIPVLVPLWFIPLVAGGFSLAARFSWAMTFLLAVFAVNSFIVLPLLSKLYGCAHCRQKDTCPWMKRAPGFQETAEILEEEGA